MSVVIKVKSKAKSKTKNKAKNKDEVTSLIPGVTITPEAPTIGQWLTLRGDHINELESVDFHLGGTVNRLVTKISNNEYRFEAAVRGGALLVAKLGGGQSFPIGRLIIG